MPAETRMPQETFDKIKDDAFEAVDPGKLEGTSVRVPVDWDASVSGSHRTGFPSAATDEARVGVRYSADRDDTSGANKYWKVKVATMANTPAGSYKTRVEDGIYVDPDEALVPSTTVTRIEDGEYVEHEIQNPRAAELVAQLAIKKINKTAEQDRKAA